LKNRDTYQCFIVQFPSQPLKYHNLTFETYV
jgi:hypothetical protein